MHDWHVLLWQVVELELRGGGELQVMVIVLWVSTFVAAVFLLAEFILKYEHVRILAFLSLPLAVCNGCTIYPIPDNWQPLWQDVCKCTISCSLT